MADITLRTVKGSELTHEELDANFTSLNDNKVETITDYSLVPDTEITKLGTVEVNANNYIHPATHQPSIIAQDSSNRFVTDAQITTWNNKQNTITDLPLTVGGTYDTSTGFKPAGYNIPNGLVKTNANGNIPTTTIPAQPVLDVGTDTTITVDQFRSGYVFTTNGMPDGGLVFTLPSPAGVVGRTVVICKTSQEYLKIQAPTGVRIADSIEGGSYTFTDQYALGGFVRITAVSPTQYILDGWGQLQKDIDLVT